jgi:hypothetical protein
MTSQPVSDDDELTQPFPAAGVVASHEPAAYALLSSFTSVEEMLRTLAYAELRAIMLAWARVPVRAPADLVRAAIDTTLDAGAPPNSWYAPIFGQCVRDTIRTETADAPLHAARKAGPVPWARPLAPGQHGDSEGLELIFHEAGEIAGRVRAHEPRSLSTAVGLTDYVRANARARARSARGASPP